MCSFLVEVNSQLILTTFALVNINDYFPDDVSGKFSKFSLHNYWVFKYEKRGN